MATNFWDDVLGLVGAVAPALATALGGPLAGTAVAFLSDQLLGKPGGTADEVKAALQGVNPEGLVRLKELDLEFKTKMTQAGIDMEKLRIEREVAYLKNQEQARETFGKDRGVFWLGVAILTSFAVLMALVLWGCYIFLTTPGEISKAEAGILATVTGIVGSIIGYAASNAQTVVNFFYGSSQGSQAKSEALGDAIAKLGNAAANRS